MINSCNYLNQVLNVNFTFTGLGSVGYACVCEGGCNGGGVPPCREQLACTHVERERMYVNMSNIHDLVCKILDKVSGMRFLIIFVIIMNF